VNWNGLFFKSSLDYFLQSAQSFISSFTEPRFFLGLESLRCEDSNPVSKHSQKVLKVQSSLDARAIARPGVLLKWAAWLWPETGVRWACLLVSDDFAKGIGVRAKRSDLITITWGK
jgi:hypothetical protein